MTSQISQKVKTNLEKVKTNKVKFSVIFLIFFTFVLFIIGFIRSYNKKNKNGKKMYNNSQNFLNGIQFSVTIIGIITVIGFLIAAMTHMDPMSIWLFGGSAIKMLGTILGVLAESI